MKVTKHKAALLWLTVILFALEVNFMGFLVAHLLVLPALVCLIFGVVSCVRSLTLSDLFRLTGVSFMMHMAELEYRDRS